MYRNEMEVDEHINGELDRLINKLESIQEDLKGVRDKKDTCTSCVRQGNEIEDTLNDVNYKCNAGIDYVRSKKR